MSYTTRHRIARGVRRATVLLLSMLASTACDTADSDARQVVYRAIDVHGGENFERVHIEFGFRDHTFLVYRDGGEFRYERIGVDDEGRATRDLMDNEGTRAWVDGEPVELDPDVRTSLETAVNSVVYFAFLPFRLDDPAVILRDLGEAEIEGRAQRKIEVTFRQDGGGRDWEDRFIYWFDTEHGTLDYLAYLYHTGEGGTRFRRAVNRRTVGGILIQDYENYTADPQITDVADYDRWFEEGRLTLVSEIRLEDVDVSAP
ncbi:MAG: hypothetical protein EA351_03525 [Gemmatimonadales bacterium]|nr:MAG: hypothetical protein EA351_03525 [Gemmatimonadales bacterium]